MTRLATLVFLCALLALPVPAQARDIVVFAAASLKTVLDDLATHYEQETGTGIALSYAGSSALARQIQQGAPADIFISANADWMDVLQADGLIDPASRADLVGNTLVLIGAGPGAYDPRRLATDLSADTRLAMALVDAVPAGIYGKAALTHLGLWTAVAPFVAQTDNVRAALRLVALGEAEFGIVYATDASADSTVHIRATFDAASHPPIRYPAAQVAGSTPAAAALLDYLKGAEARAIFAAQGFITEGLE